MKTEPGSQPLGLLVSDLARLLRRDFDRRVAGMGLTQAQWRTLLRLSRSEGCRQADLATLMEIAPITLARFVDRLEQSRLVERRRHPTDRRAVQLFLTARGHRLVAQMRPIASRTYERALEGVVAADRVRLTRILQRMRENLLEPAADADTLPATNADGR